MVGVGSLDANGLYTAPNGIGPATITATGPTLSGNTSINVVNGAPTVATPAGANPTSVSGTTTDLSVLGADDAGEANVKYAWSVTSKPAGAADPTYSINGTNGASPNGRQYPPDKARDLLPNEPRHSPMVVRPNLNYRVLIQVLLGFPLRRFLLGCG